MLNLLDELNPEQRQAAETTEGPVLILAGAGTGKTRAITFRMANMIANGVPAEAILAVTFTNKAAEEMRNRVSGILLRAGVPPAQPWLSTFHSLCARLLRRLVGPNDCRSCLEACAISRVAARSRVNPFSAFR